MLTYTNSTPPVSSLPPTDAPPLICRLYILILLLILIPFWYHLQPPSHSPSPLCPLLWRITNSNHVTCTNTIYQAEVFYSLILDPSLFYQDNIIVYHSSIKTDLQIGILNVDNLWPYASGKTIYQENPYWNKAKDINEYEYYILSMKKYIS